MRRVGSSRLAAVAALSVGVAVAVGFWLTRSTPSPSTSSSPQLANARVNAIPSTSASGPASAALPDIQDSMPAAAYSCAQCHAMPPPDALARDDWPKAIHRINDIIREYALGEPLSEDALRQIIGYYVDHAPTSLPRIPPPSGPSPVRFAGAPIGRPPTPPPAGRPPVLGVLAPASIASPTAADVLVPDIGENRVSLLTRAGQSFIELTIAEINAPCVATAADIDGDGDQDVLVASLGQMMPTDEPVGSIHLLENRGRGEFVSRILLDRLARVTDVQAADMDGDGDLDVVFAAFGLYVSGEIAWLEQTAPGEFAYRAIHSTNGATHVRLADFDADGATDIAALISQQHEAVVLFRNAGRGRFESSDAYRAPHPLWGMSSLTLADLDQDGDQDLVITNGDALDQVPSPKPYHGAAWLENQGDMRFTHHPMSPVPGAYCASAADFDLDGDIDVVVSSMMNDWEDLSNQALTLLENDGSQSFTARPLSHSPAWQVSCLAVDLNADGRPDIISSGMYVMPPFARVGRITAFLNTPPAP